MPRKKVTDGPGNGAARPGGRKKPAGRKRERDEFSSEDDDLDGSPGSDGFQGPNSKRGPGGKGGSKSPTTAAVIVNEPDHSKEKIVRICVIGGKGGVSGLYTVSWGSNKCNDPNN